MPETRQYTVSLKIDAPADPEMFDMIEEAVAHYIAAEPWQVQTNDTMIADEIEYAPIGIVHSSLHVEEQPFVPANDPISDLVNTLVVTVPSEDARNVIRRIFGTVGPGQNDRHMDHWARGKRMQSSGLRIPRKHEDEHAVGLYDQEIRPVLVQALFIWAAQHGAEFDDRCLPKATNDLVMIEQGYRVEIDRENLRLEVIRPDFTLMREWPYEKSAVKGELPAGIPTIDEIMAMIHADISERADG